MSLFSRIAWKEGMFLVPQHFQQLQRSLDATQQIYQRGTHPLGWGIISLQLDEAALTQGRLELRRCQALMPDGTVVDVPELEAAPPARGIQLPPTQRFLDVYLTIPSGGPNAPLMTSDGSRSDIRYTMRVFEVRDEIDPTCIRPIDVAVRNLRFAVTGDPLEGLVTLKIAQVQRNAEGVLCLRPDYVPPALRLAASSSLDRLCRDLLSMVAARARSMTEDRRSRGNDFEATSSEVTAFLFMQTLLQYTPMLQHLIELPGTHPASLYETLLGLAGSLNAFALSDELALPAYNHESLYDCFKALDRRIRELLNRLFRTRHEVIPLTRKEPFWHGSIADSELRSQGEFVLAVTSDLSPTDLIGRLPNAMLISESESIARLMRAMVGGVRIVPLPRAPAAIPVRQDACYFRLLTEGADWERIRATGQISLFVPGILPGVKPELFAIRPGGPR